MKFFQKIKKEDVRNPSTCHRRHTCARDEATKRSPRMHTADRTEDDDDVSDSKRSRTETDITDTPTMTMHEEQQQQQPSPMEIDEDLHSRQLAVYGRDSFRKLAQAGVLIVGARGLGIEIAKNVVLAGVKRVTVWDEGACGLEDLASQFYVGEGDVVGGSTTTNVRSVASVSKLQELNPAVDCVAHRGEVLSEDVIATHGVVVCTETSEAEAKRVDEVCRRVGSAFIKADIRGVFGSVFCDFGQGFNVMDVDGEEALTCIVASVSNDSPALVTCIEDERVELQDGQKVTFTEVRGMSELNGVTATVKNVKKHSFELDLDTSSFSSVRWRRHRDASQGDQDARLCLVRIGARQSG